LLQVALELVSAELNLDVVRLFGVDFHVRVFGSSVVHYTVHLSGDPASALFIDRCHKGISVSFHEVKAWAVRRGDSSLLDIPAASIVVESGQVDSSD
jgi:hypothetical protein